MVEIKRTFIAAVFFAITLAFGWPTVGAASCMSNCLNKSKVDSCIQDRNGAGCKKACRSWCNRSQKKVGATTPEEVVDELPDVMEMISVSTKAPDSCDVPIGYESLNIMAEDDFWGTDAATNKQACRNPKKLFDFVCQKHDKRKRTYLWEYEKREAGLVLAEMDAELKRKEKNAKTDEDRKALEKYRKIVEFTRARVKDFQNGNDPYSSMLLKTEPRRVKKGRRTVIHEEAILGELEYNYTENPDFSVDAVTAAYTAARGRLTSDTGAKKFPKSTLHDSVYKSVLNDGSIKQRVLNEVFPSIKDSMYAVLVNERGRVMDEFKKRWQNERRYSAAQFRDKENQIFAMFERLEKAIKDVSIDWDAGGDICMLHQKNTIVKRLPGGATKIVMCPATLLGSDDEIAGSLAKALGNAIDSCALDQMSFEDKGKRYGMGQLFEPLRSCVGEKMGLNAGRDRRMLSPFPEVHSSSHKEGVGKAIENFETLSGSPHCAKPFTAAEAAKVGSAGQRDQSNNAVAQFFATKATADWLNKTYNKGGSYAKQRDMNENIQQALGAYCAGTAQYAGGKGPHSDPRELFAKVVANDPEMRKRLGCGKNKSESRKVDNVTKEFFKDPNYTGPRGKKQVPASCDGSFRGGFAKYLFALDDHAQQLAENTKPGAIEAVAAPAVPAAPSAEPPAKPESPPVTLSQDGDAVEPVTPPDAPAAAPTPEPAPAVAAEPAPAPPARDALEGERVGAGNNATIDSSKFGSAEITAWRGAIDEAIGDEALRGKCRGLFENGLPISQDVFNDRCADSENGRFDVDLWNDPEFFDGKTVTYKSSSYPHEIQMGCRARCLCAPPVPAPGSGEGESECFMGELTYFGQKPAFKKPNPAAAANPALVQADIDLFDTEDTGKGRYSLAGKTCYLDSPDGTVAGVTSIGDQCMSNKQSGSDASEIVLAGQLVQVIGELSGAKIEYGCSYRCSCDQGPRCIAMITRPGENAPVAPATKGDYELAAKGERTADGKRIIHYAPSAVSVKLSLNSESGGAGRSAVAPAGSDDLEAIGTDAGAGAGAGGAEGRGAASANSPDPLAGLKYTHFDLDVLESQADSQAEVPDGDYRSRHELRQRNRRKALNACLATVNKAYNKKLSDPKVLKKAHANFCARAKQGKWIIDEPYHPKTLRAGNSKTYNMSFSCRYSCKKECETNLDSFATECIHVAYDGPFTEEALPKKEEYDLEQARVADWYVHHHEADARCQKLTRGAEFAGSSPACIEHPDESGITLTDDEFYLTKYRGDLTGARLPYFCKFECDCTKGFESCRGVSAVPLRISDGTPGTYVDFEKYALAKNDLKRPKVKRPNSGKDEPGVGQIGGGSKAKPKTKNKSVGKKGKPKANRSISTSVGGDAAKSAKKVTAKPSGTSETPAKPKEPAEPKVEVRVSGDTGPKPPAKPRAEPKVEPKGKGDTVATDDKPEDKPKAALEDDPAATAEADALCKNDKFPEFEFLPTDDYLVSIGPMISRTEFASASKVCQPDRRVDQNFVVHMYSEIKGKFAKCVYTCGCNEPKPEGDIVPYGDYRCNRGGAGVKNKLISKDDYEMYSRQNRAYSSLNMPLITLKAKFAEDKKLLSTDEKFTDQKRCTKYFDNYGGLDDNDQPIEGGALYKGVAKACKNKKGKQKVPVDYTAITETLSSGVFADECVVEVDCKSGKLNPAKAKLTYSRRWKGPYGESTSANDHKGCKKFYLGIKPTNRFASKSAKAQCEKDPGNFFKVSVPVDTDVWNGKGSCQYDCSCDKNECLLTGYR